MNNNGETRSIREVTKLMVDIAVAKHKAPYEQMFFKAFMAGVYLSMGGFLNVTLQGGSPNIMAQNPGLLRILGAFVFPVGLVMIVLNGAELLTSNMMTMTMGVIKRAVPIWSLPVNWIIVFFGNLVGCLFFDAILVRYTGLLDTTAYKTYLGNAVASKAIHVGWHQVFLRGIGCNWLVCVAVWQATASREAISKIVAAWFPIWTFVALNYDHVVANMFTIPLTIMLDATPLTAAGYIRKSLIASLIGNIVGAQFVGLPMLWYFWKDISVQDERVLLREIDEGNVNPVAIDAEGAGRDPTNVARSAEEGKAGYTVTTQRSGSDHTDVGVDANGKH